MKLSQRSLKLRVSALHEFFARAKRLEAEGKKIISLGVGEPFEDVTQDIKLAAIRTVLKKTGYTPSLGMVDLRKKVANKYGVASDEVLISHGAKSVLGVFMQCLVDPGDKIFIPAPYYPPFVEIAKFLDAEIVLLDTRPDNFQLTSENVFQAVMRYGVPKILLINTPNNPTGAEYGRDELEKIVEMANVHGITIIADECYGKFSEDYCFSMHGLSEKTVIINSSSKTNAMTGWRIGWGVGPRELIKQAGIYLDNFVGCPNAIAQEVFLETGFNGKNMVTGYYQQKQIIEKWLKHLRIPCMAGESAIYVFPDFSEFMGKDGFSDSVDLASTLLNEDGVVVTPGSTFGETYCNHLRISYSVPVGILNEGFSLIRERLIRLRK